MLGVLVMSLGIGLVMIKAKGDLVKDISAYATKFGDAEDYCLTKVCLKYTKEDYPKVFPKGCVQAAADILDKLDVSVEPCEDFYQFACGSYIEQTVIPDDHTKVSSFSTINDKLNEQVVLLLW